MRAEDIYSPDYLAFARRADDSGFILDPRNRFNQSQRLASAEVFGHAVAGETAPLGDLGVFLTRANLAGDMLSVKVSDAAAWSRVRSALPSLDLARSVWLEMLWLQHMVFDVEQTLRVLAPGARRFSVTVRDAGGAPVPDAKVVLVYDAARRLGAEVRTGDSGKAALAVPASWQRCDAFSVMPRHSLWSHGRRDWAVPDGDVEVVLRSLDAGTPNPLHRYLRPGDAGEGAGVRVGVIDAGVGPHGDLVLAGGANFAVNEAPEDATSWADNGVGHGTHVAGIIAGSGNVQPAWRGLAPAASLYSYRVCARGQREAADVSIASAIEEALEDRCDLINISMGYSVESHAISRRVRQALAQGTVVIAAAGNGARKRVSYPAATPGVIGVSALGHAGRVPPGTVSALAEATPRGSDPADYLAAFSNCGPEISATGPGVGIVSCHPGDRYSVEDGTSMAAPVVTGLAARALSQRPDLLGAARDQQRADAVRTLLLGTARSLGFEAVDVGRGLP